jgi:hypothetical protein
MLRYNRYSQLSKPISGKPCRISLLGFDFLGLFFIEAEIAA